jgi:hypothetical protein
MGASITRRKPPAIAGVDTAGSRKSDPPRRKDSNLRLLVD